MDRTKEYNMFCDHVENMPDDKYNALGDSVQAWYKKEFPSDTLGSDIDKYTTFYDIVDSLYCKRNVYIYLPDSIVRERVFQKIAEMIGLSYDTIYETWMAA